MVRRHALPCAGSLHGGAAAREPCSNAARGDGLRQGDVQPERRLRSPRGLAAQTKLVVAECKVVLADSKLIKTLSKVASKFKTCTQIITMTDEAAEQAAFQEAVAAWRTRGAPPEPRESTSSPKKLNTVGRTANDVADELDELMHPSGPLYSDCATAPAHECCRTRHSFAISRRSFLRRDATGCSAKCATLLRDGEDSA